ncbi:MAG: O-antigen ligase family protein [Bacteroidia bacterium]
MKTSFFLYSNNSTSLRQVMWMLAAASFVLPVPLNNVLLAMVFIVNILTGSTGNFQSNIRQLVFWVPMLLFGLYLLSVINSTHTTEAWHYAERKLALLLLPLSFAFVSKVEDSVLQKVFKCYVGSILLAALYCLQRAYVLHNYTGSSEYYFYHNLSGFISVNAIYFSAYIAFAIVLLWLNRNSWQLHKLLFAAVLLFLVCMLYLLASKMVLMFLLLFFVAQQFFTRWSVKKLLIGGAATVGLLLLLLLSDQFVLKRYVAEWNTDFSVVRQEKYFYNTPFSGSSLRLVLWKHSLHLVREQQAWITGVGTGDFQDLLNERYRESGMFMGDERRNDKGYEGYNPHNQYMEALLSTGLVGLACLLLWLAALYRHFYHHRQYHFLLLIVFVSILCLTECFLSANKGIVWFVFFTCLLVNSKPTAVKSQKK